MAKYVVNVIMSTSVEIEVEALNENEAQTIALEKAEAKAKPFTPDDWDYEIETVFREEDFVDEEDGWCVSPWGTHARTKKILKKFQNLLTN